MGVEFLHVNGLNKEKSLKVFVSKTEKQTIFNERICGEKIITIYYHKAYFYYTCGYCCSGERLGHWDSCFSVSATPLNDVRSSAMIDNSKLSGSFF